MLQVAKAPCLFLFLGLLQFSSLASAWLSGDESTPGPAMSDVVLLPTGDNEHGRIMLEAFAGVDSSTSDYYEILTNTNIPFTVYTVGDVSDVPGDLSKVDGLKNRSLNIAGLSALPDHAYSLWDFLSGYEICPEGTIDASTTDAASCHTFSSHMGAANSNHFPPQAEETYKWYHSLALASADECVQLQEQLEAAFGGSLARPYVTECQVRTLALEAFGQHFLQDVWAVGHMWERWGSTDLRHYQGPARARALVVALTAGLIHGCDAVPGCNVVGGDAMSYGGRPNYFQSNWSPERHWGIGDKYLDRMEQYSETLYSEQSARLKKCTTDSAREVIRRLQGDGDFSPIPHPTSNYCLGQRNTNFAMAKGWGVLGLEELGVPVPDGILTLVGCPIVLIGEVNCLFGPLPESLKEEFRREWRRVKAYFLLYGDELPNQTTLASGALTPIFMGVGPNSAPNPGGWNAGVPVGPTASFSDPDTFGTIENPPDHIKLDQPNLVNTVDIHKRVFNKAHLKPLCEDDEVEPEALRSRYINVRDEGGPNSGQELAVTLQICTEFASRHMQLGGEQSMCQAVGYEGDWTITDFEPDVAYPPSGIPGQTERQYLAEQWCEGESRVLNDTGVAFGGNYPSGNNQGCSGVAISQQDCANGRDASHYDDSDGHAGFSFTKLGPDGASLPADAMSWDCVRDNITGLVWEVKTNDGGVRDSRNIYRWGGKTAQGSDSGARYSDWDELVDFANSEKLCGAEGWRVPSVSELESLVNYGSINPAIDDIWFPYTANSNSNLTFTFWTSTPSVFVDNHSSAWVVGFYSGEVFDWGRVFGLSVRLVR